MADTRDDSAEAERKLARYAAYGIPAVTVAGALGVGLVMSLGPAILVLAAGALLGTIALLWASIRTLSGDAPLPLELEAMAVRSRKVDGLGEQKRRVLRALKDLELEHSVGKIDDKDYASLGDRFREEAKALMREMDGQVDPQREEAERIARKHLARKGFGEGGATAKEAAEVDDDEHVLVPEARAAAARVSCPKCRASNEPDAAFCKKCGTSLANATEKTDG